MITASCDDNVRAGDAGAALAGLAATFSMEVAGHTLDTPDNPLGLMAPGRCVYLPFLSGAAFADNLDACRRLAAMGLRPVPHLAARALTSRDELDRDLARYADAGADAFLLIAGDLEAPAGPFADSMQVLETGLFERHGVNRLAVAGHPEGHPHADADELIAALRTKSAYARETGTEMWITTQFVFDAEPLKRWDEELRQAGIDLPVCAGVPGPAKLSSLIYFAFRCGVGASARVLTNRPSAMKLLGRWTPEPLINEIAGHMAVTPDTLIRGVHIYTFGGVKTALDWIEGLQPYPAVQAGE